MIAPHLQKRLAILGAVVLVCLVLAANAHMVTLAFLSQPACVAPDPGRQPARPGC